MAWPPPPGDQHDPHQRLASDEEDAADELNWMAAMATTFAMGSKKNGSHDYSSAVLKPFVSSIYPVFVLQYGLLVLFGFSVNSAVIFFILRRRLFREITHSFVLNLCLSHCVQCLVVMPITLTVLLLQNWVLGQFFCYFLPMLQDIPMHVSIITHLLISLDRLTWLGDEPMKCRLPAFVCSCATWLAGIVIALPYPIYITYMDLGSYMKEFRGVGFCTVNLVDDMHEYMRGIFITMYAVPAVLLCYLYIRTTRQLQPPDGPLGMIMFEARADARNQQRYKSSFSSRHHRKATTTTTTMTATANTSPPRRYDMYDAELDLAREKRTQNYLGSMAVVQVICISPLMVLRLARLVLEETYENSDHFDLTYLMFVWIAYLPTAINPCIYASWMMSRTAKDRLRGYFQLSSSKRRTSSTTSAPEAEDVSEEVTLGNGQDSEAAALGAGRGQQPGSFRHNNQKRPSKASVLTTVTSVRSLRSDKRDLDNESLPRESPARSREINQTPSATGGLRAEKEANIKSNWRADWDRRDMELENDRDDDEDDGGDLEEVDVVSMERRDRHWAKMQVV